MSRKVDLKIKKMVRFVMALVMLVGVVNISIRPTEASAWNNARTYYSTYGDSVVFRPMTETDGLIYYATKAKTATTSTRFLTLGWKFTVKNTSGTTLQTIYFKLGGNYMYGTNTVVKGNYEYNQYALSLYQLKSRMNTKASKALRTGKATIRLDACMTIVKNGSVKGSMNDSGSFSGKVYTSYSGICGAANWSPTAKQMLQSYFDKYVEDLFYSVDVIAGEGIKSVSGSGMYCYGTEVAVQAIPDRGYDFANWTGLLRGGRSIGYFFVSESGVCMAVGEPQVLRVYYHRNQSAGDYMEEYQEIRYNKSGGKLEWIPWRKNGKLPLGWSRSSSAQTAQYALGQSVSAEWIEQYAPMIHLYAVWEDSGENLDPPTPTPDPPAPTPDPPVPTPDPPAPTPDPPAPTPDPPSSTPDSKPTGEKKTTTKRIVRCRFISSKYFEDEQEHLVSKEQGGLSADSVWVTDQVHRQLLRYALRGK